MENFEINDYPNYSRKKLIVILIGVAVILINTLLSFILDEKSPSSLILFYVVAIGINFLTFAWCYYDSLERGESFGMGWRFMLIIFGVFALIVYLFKSRGFKRGLIAIGCYLLLLFGTSFCSGLLAAIIFTIIGVK